MQAPGPPHALLDVALNCTYKWKLERVKYDPWHTQEKKGL